MKRVVVALLITLPLIADFDFGECSGSGSFEQEIVHYSGDYENTALVGTIPIGIEGLKIELNSDEDVDIRLYGENEDKIVHWPYGLLSKSYEESTIYQDVNVTYSGYDGINGDKGHEFIEVEGVTPTIMTMKAFGYKAGYATVNYSWTGKEGCTEEESGEGNFTQQIEENATTFVGTIPPNVKNVEVYLSSVNDIDIQLYGADGTAIVSWQPKGLLSSDSLETVLYHDMNITWSGYNGVDGQKGQEYIKISSVSTEVLVMKVFGYQSGTADVKYTWGNREDDDTNITDTIAPIITLDSDTITIIEGNKYVDSGVTANDDVDGDISDKIISESNLDTSIIGTYYIKYNVTDSAGNSAEEVIRTINIVGADEKLTENEVIIEGSDTTYISIQDAVNASVDGDTLLIGNGTYEAGIVLNNNITLRNMEGADNVVITGDRPIVSWEYDETKELYYASSPCTIPAKEGESVGGIEMLFMNGEEQKAARYPNSGYLKVENSPDNSTFSLEEFDGDSLDIKDAVAHIRMSNWRVASRRVASFSDGYINLTEEAKSDSSLITSDFMVFFTQVLGAIDANNEWAWNSGKIYMKSSDEPKNVTVACSEYGIYLDENAKKVTIEGLNISRISGHGITKKFDTRKSADDDLVIKDNNISYVTKRGIYLRDFYSQTERLPADTLIEGNEVSHVREGGIWLFADNALVQNNYIHDIGGSVLDDDVLAYGSGNMLTGINITVSSGTKILNNRLDKIGYNGIAIDNGWAGWKSNEGRVIANNYITNAMLMLNDGGCIYTYINKIDFINDGTAESRERDVIRDNIMQNCIGSSASVVVDPWKGLGERAGEGIYLDDLSSYTDIYNNTVIGATKNLFLHNSFKVDAHDNSLITPFTISIYLSQGGADGADREDVFINNNLIDSRSELTYKLIYNDGQEFLTVADNNIVRVDSGETLGVREGYGTEPNISLSQWHDMGYDIDTTVIEDSTEPVVLINPSLNDVLFSNLEGCRKFDNAPLDTTSQIVVPYASLVLFGCEYYIAGTYSESK